MIQNIKFMCLLDEKTTLATIKFFENIEKDYATRGLCCLPNGDIGAVSKDCHQ